jgi:hypothetical protein
MAPGVYGIQAGWVGYKCDVQSSSLPPINHRAAPHIVVPSSTIAPHLQPPHQMTDVFEADHHSPLRRENGWKKHIVFDPAKAFFLGPGSKRRAFEYIEANLLRPCYGVVLRRQWVRKKEDTGNVWKGNWHAVWAAMNEMLNELDAKTWRPPETILAAAGEESGGVMVAGWRLLSDDVSRWGFHR